MEQIQSIIESIKNLNQENLVYFRNWFEEYIQTSFNQKQDEHESKIWDSLLENSQDQLENLAKKAIQEYREGKTISIGIDEL